MSDVIETPPVKVRPRPPAAGMGRPVGAKGKFSRTIKEQMLKALDKLGGVDYLVRLGNEQPAVFGSLLGRIIPMEVVGANGGPLVVSWDMSGFSTPNAPAIASPAVPTIEGRVEDAVEVTDDPPARWDHGEVADGEA
jgi:hypothetical protein